MTTEQINIMDDKKLEIYRNAMRDIIAGISDSERTSDDAAFINQILIRARAAIFDAGDAV